ncbi:PTS glucitol/sorbitol transporter subunit IIC [Clostridium estertheticum]|uniref:PTS glucitol/sorbitol transporter subunit IIC n=1 Tax=Clostridium estertheticum TaxID=238834 RepID=UPI001C0D631B|nr:PTS glucitol/sorbitol transporter subunit IIC [Clostridium estertheticum]MBU3215006.1 PTS glucitol/sorbitol transporter subunit IIC [Clostridium estertheticum]WAG57255.1 PTS glucitol/sorbitol transporter subunit IIC [Clostridium estertheticum]
MDLTIKIAEGFIGLFQIGSKTFLSWMTGIVPLVLLLLVFMNTVINLIGQEKVNRFAQWASKYSLMRNMVLPFVASFTLCNPAAFTLGKFLPEFYKPSYYAAVGQYCHTSSGIFPHINPGELFLYLGVSAGITTLGLSVTPLAIRYLLVGFVMNAVGAYVTDFTTAYVCKKSGIKLSKIAKV